MREVEFLGQWIACDGVAPVKAKLKALHDRETPINVKDFWSVFGLQIIITGSYLAM